jgi:hypothetical protein
MSGLIHSWSPSHKPSGTTQTKTPDFFTRDVYNARARIATPKTPASGYENAIAVCIAPAAAVVVLPLDAVASLLSSFPLLLTTADCVATAI